MKGRSGGLKGALGSCFGDFRCAFSACSSYFSMHALHIGQCHRCYCRVESNVKIYLSVDSGLNIV